MSYDIFYTATAKHIVSYGYNEIFCLNQTVRDTSIPWINFACSTGSSPLLGEIVAVFRIKWKRGAE